MRVITTNPPPQIKKIKKTTTGTFDRLNEANLEGNEFENQTDTKHTSQSVFESLRTQHVPTENPKSSVPIFPSRNSLSPSPSHPFGNASELRLGLGFASAKKKKTQQCLQKKYTIAGKSAYAAAAKVPLTNRRALNTDIAMHARVSGRSQTLITFETEPHNRFSTRATATTNPKQSEHKQIDCWSENDYGDSNMYPAGVGEDSTGTNFYAGTNPDVDADSHRDMYNLPHSNSQLGSITVDRVRSFGRGSVSGNAHVHVWGEDVAGCIKMADQLLLKSSERINPRGARGDKL